MPPHAHLDNIVAMEIPDGVGTEIFVRKKPAFIIIAACMLWAIAPHPEGPQKYQLPVASFLNFGFDKTKPEVDKMILSTLHKVHFTLCFD